MFRSPAYSKWTTNCFTQNYWEFYQNWTICCVRTLYNRNSWKLVILIITKGCDPAMKSHIYFCNRVTFTSVIESKLLIRLSISFFFCNLLNWLILKFKKFLFKYQKNLGFGEWVNHHWVWRRGRWVCNCGRP